jgi:hypothetical protein
MPHIREDGDMTEVTCPCGNQFVQFQDIRVKHEKQRYSHFDLQLGRLCSSLKAVGRRCEFEGKKFYLAPKVHKIKISEYGFSSLLRYLHMYVKLRLAGVR